MINIISMKGKTEKDSNGYLIFKDSGKHIHRWVAERKYGKESIEGKHIHHIDGDKTNNKPNNLILLSKEDHYDLSQHENRTKLLTDFIIYLSLIYLVLINLLMHTSILNQEVSLAIARISVLIIFFIALELRQGYIGKWIRKPKG